MRRTLGIVLSTVTRENMFLMCVMHDRQELRMECNNIIYYKLYSLHRKNIIHAGEASRLVQYEGFRCKTIVTSYIK